MVIEYGLANDRLDYMFSEAERAIATALD